MSKILKAPSGKVECPRCDGYGNDGFDEVGAPYACYYCGCSGWADAGAVAAERRDEAWAFFVAAERAIVERARLGVPDGWSYYYDEDVGELVMVPPRQKLYPAVAMPLHCVDNDIPF